MILYRIDRDRRLVLISAMGTLSGQEITDFQRHLRADPGFDPGFASLSDLREASFARIDAAEVRRHAAEDPFAPQSPRAMVVSGDPADIMVRMFGAYSDLAGRAAPVRAFRDVESAEAWLDAACGRTK